MAAFVKQQEQDAIQVFASWVAPFEGERFRACLPFIKSAKAFLPFKRFLTELT
jgi:hypothetical protein